MDWASPCSKMPKSYWNSAARLEISYPFKLSNGNLIVTITDDGKPFDPFDERSPDVTLSVEDRPIGGLGVHIARNVMDRVRYERHGKKNFVRLEKTIEPEETRAP